MNKKQWREAVRKEAGISLNLVQIDYIFDKIDNQHESFIDLKKWLNTFQDDGKHTQTVLLYYSYQPNPTFKRKRPKKLDDSR
jgi:hypothetical protein